MTVQSAVTASLPVANPTTSYWQAEASTSALHDHGRDAQLPDKATVVDVAIVGSGISGAVAAYMLQRGGNVGKRGEGRPSRQRAPSIAMLEARQACSGATGRNGGHCRPDTFAGFEKYAAIVGQEQAHKILQNEWETFELIENMVAAESLDCDWWRGRTLGVYRSQDIKRSAKETMERYKAYAGQLKPGVRFIDDPEEARAISRVKDAFGAAVWPAGSLHPLRFVHALLQRCLQEDNFALYTHTPVERIAKDGDGTCWQLSTPRGCVQARQVLLATNGYSTKLLPSLQDFLTPHRSQCSAVDPPRNFVNAMALNTTSSMIKASGDYEYLTQQPSAGGPNTPKGLDQRPGTGAFILGGGHPYAPRHEQIDTFDDSVVVKSITNHLDSFPHQTFIDWQPTSGRLTHVWTGIQGCKSTGCMLALNSSDVTRPLLQIQRIHCRS